jgi:hypothetical protein
MPRADGTVYHLMLGGRDLDHAFEQFKDSWFEAADHTRSVGVWMNAALVARVLPITDKQTGELTCFMQPLFP